MITKEKLIGVIQNLPENLSMDDLLDKLMLIQKIDKGLTQSMDNQIISDENLDSDLPEWLS